MLSLTILNIKNWINKYKQFDKFSDKNGFVNIIYIEGI